MATKLNKNWFQKLFNIPGTMDCKIREPHAHKYVSASGLSTYRNSEKEYIGDLNWTEEAFHLSQDIVDMTEYDLFITEDNVNYLRLVESRHAPYLEYEYSYEEPNLALGVALDNLALGYALSDTEYDWTRNPNRSNLTGNVRDVEYKYYGYRISINQKGERILRKSMLFNNVTDLIKNCPYFIRDDFYVQEYSKPYKKVKTK